MSVLNKYWSDPATLDRIVELLLRGLAAVAIVSVVVIGVQAGISYLGGGETAILAIWALVGFVAVIARAFRLTYPERGR